MLHTNTDAMAMRDLCFTLESSHVTGANCALTAQWTNFSCLPSANLRARKLLSDSLSINFAFFFAFFGDCLRRTNTDARVFLDMKTFPSAVAFPSSQNLLPRWTPDHLSLSVTKLTLAVAPSVSYRGSRPKPIRDFSLLITRLKSSTITTALS
jgi:hypothetical protein